MVTLRADPWRPDFGAGAEIGFDDDISNAAVDVAVETTDWTRGMAVAPCDPEAFCFVDGVMRSELRVLASDGDARAWGLVGSFAAGGGTGNSSASFFAVEEPIGSVMLLGSRGENHGVNIQNGAGELP